MAADVLADTNGKVVIEVYPSSQLGDTADVLEQAKAGSNVGVIIDTGMLADYVSGHGNLLWTIRIQQC